MMHIGVPALIVALLYLVFQPLCFWKICQKAGYNGAWGLLSVVPIGAVGLLGFLAFSDWPPRAKDVA
ncbi:hypothetical protein BV911_12260 [Pseudoruegeria sp. SK021]|nr:hypothetical protein BV911_12260 [Pseudoruegeria sp. SK021]